jgi:hypothetical protein
MRARALPLQRLCEGARELVARIFVAGKRAVVPEVVYWRLVLQRSRYSRTFPAGLQAGRRSGNSLPISGAGAA